MRPGVEEVAGHPSYTAISPACARSAKPVFLQIDRRKDLNTLSVMEMEARDEHDAVLKNFVLDFHPDGTAKIHIGPESRSVVEYNPHGLQAHAVTPGSALIIRPAHCRLPIACLA